MSTTSFDDDDGGGYGKPPKRSRFKPGQSGNPRGRRRQFEFDPGEWVNPLRKYLLEPMMVSMNGKKVQKPVVDLIIMGAIKRALNGCPKNLDVLLRSSGGLTALIADQKRLKSSADQALIDAVRKEVDEWTEMENKK